MATLTQELIRLQERVYEESLRSRRERAISRACCPKCVPTVVEPREVVL
jgi:hypothetical protein